MNEIKTTITEQLQQLQLLMHRASQQKEMVGGRRLNPSRGQGRVLAVLEMKPEITQRELTYLLGMSRQSLAELLTKLEKGGLITRSQSEDDKRIMTVKLTEEGAKAAEVIDENTSDDMDALDCLSEEELQTFSDYLGKLIKQYEQLFPDDAYEERRKRMEGFVSNYRHSHSDRHGGSRQRGLDGSDGERRSIRGGGGDNHRGGRSIDRRSNRGGGSEHRDKWQGRNSRHRNSD
ncbi:MAG: MarR family transcriptional regulator [Coriobacteriia bacterium]|nr:MarR family transcriptional regulator [Coriobacteriia bacterium]